MQAFQFKLYTSKKNKKLHRLIHIAAGIYNHCIKISRRYYRLYKKHLNKYDLQKHLTKLKKLSIYSYWKELGSQAIQDITDRIDRAYKLFFKALKSNIRCSPPGFCKRSKYKSFTLKQAGYELIENNKIRIGKQVFKFHYSRNILGTIKTVTIKRDTLGDIYIYFACQLEEIEPKEVTSVESVGLDFGLKTFLTLSNGQEIESPLFYKVGTKALKKAQQALSSKTKGSNNRRKQVLNVARRHKEISNQRKDHHYRVANWLVKTYKTICIEDLCLKGMQKLFGKKINDLGFSKFINILEWKCIKASVELIKIDRFYPSSKTCNICLSVKEDLKLSDRQWQCHNCKEIHKRDINAAINIHRVGTSTLGLGNIRPLKAIAA